jgi:DNA-binding GntR family transcriptional regulator
VVGWEHLPGSTTTMPSKTQGLIEAITARIRAGEFGPGDKLPSGRELCEEYGVSMMVVRMAVERLRAAHLIVSAPGSGYYVSGGPSDQPTREA